MAENISARWIVLLCITLLFGLSAIGGEREKTAVEGLVIVKSAQPMEKTLADLRGAVDTKGLTYFTTFAHAENAGKHGLDLAPASVIVFGNPMLGTPLMQARPTMAIDLPQKMLVWEDEKGQVWIAYNDPQYLAERHSVVGQEQVFGRIGETLEELARTAAGGN
jgi:uncharacterized protein (DUF302 family)